MNALLCSLKFFATVALDTLLALRNQEKLMRDIPLQHGTLLLRTKGLFLGLQEPFLEKRQSLFDSKVAEMPCLGLYELS